MEPTRAAHVPSAQNLGAPDENLLLSIHTKLNKAWREVEGGEGVCLPPPPKKDFAPMGPPDHSSGGGVANYREGAAISEDTGRVCCDKSSPPARGKRRQHDEHKRQDKFHPSSRR
ncbi:hypothetical protein ACOMHN_002926 [Nucella lapillus]